MGSGSHGGVRWDLPSFPGLDLQRVARAAAKVVARRLQERLRSGSTKAPGLAKWLADQVEVVGNAVRWPHSAAVERLGLSDVDKSWLDEAMRVALAEERKQ